MKKNALLKNLNCLAILVFGLLPLGALGGPAVLDSATNPINGHLYYLLDHGDWTNAENTAVGLGGHLATIRNLTEKNWVWDRWGTNRNLWIGLHDPVIGDGNGTQHAANFVWSSGESASYRAWSPGDPNNTSGLEYFAAIIMKSTLNAGTWNDAPESGPCYGVAEVPVCTPHRATATAGLFNGTNFVVSATITDPGCGYTNVPQVLIQGGGGSGATANATVNNGVVTAINIITTGSGYTNAPQIVIDPPPFMPTLDIHVSAVKVAQHVMPGVNYQLQSSSNLVNWVAAGPVFTATNDTMVTEFEIDLIGQYFRILQMP